MGGYINPKLGPPPPPGPPFWLWENCFIMFCRPPIPPIFCSTLGSIIRAISELSLFIWPEFKFLVLMSPFLPNRPLIPPIFLTIWANLPYWVRSSCTSRFETPAPLATRNTRPVNKDLVASCLQKELAPSSTVIFNAILS